MLTLATRYLDHPPRVVVRLAGDLDLATSDQLEAHLTELMDRGASFLHLDFGPDSFLDSSGILALVRVGARLRTRGGKMVVSGPRRRLGALSATLSLYAELDLRETEKAES
ncbi:MAG TPA: STAS domain-containing protein [Candidatus Nitrosotenuis sp.]|jgi:anti-anti-sigma factor|nr:STAS domain-containing protein [Candidatus Nitrosotenuis sp.]